MDNKHIVGQLVYSLEQGLGMIIKIDLEESYPVTEKQEYKMLYHIEYFSGKFGLHSEIVIEGMKQDLKYEMNKYAAT